MSFRGHHDWNWNVCIQKNENLNHVFVIILVSDER
jgi:hypothetical protein